MAWTRADLISTATGRYTRLSAQAKLVATTDTVDGYGQVYDAVFLKFGITDASTGKIDGTIANDKIDAAQCLLKYYICDRFLDTLAAEQSHSESKYQSNRTQIYNQVKDMRDDAANACALLGYPVLPVASDGGSSSAASWGRTLINTDWIEPSAS